MPAILPSTRRPFNETASTRSDMSTAGRALIFRSGFRSSVPAVTIAWLVRPGFFEELQNNIPDKFEKVVASIIGAMTAVVFFWVVYSQFISPWTALFGTAILALGTSMWSTATRALWQHGPLVLMFSVVMLLMVRAPRRPALVQYAGLVLAMT